MIKDSGQRLGTIEDPMDPPKPRAPLGTVGDNWGWSREVGDGKVQRADLTCNVIRKVAPFVLSKF